MHIAEGVLTAPVLLSGAAIAAAGTAVGLQKIDYDRIMTVAILAAAFFVATLVHVPIGPASGHLVLNGLMGVLLGWAAFPAILVGLLLQALLFQFGGITVLGVTTVNLALPAVICGCLCRSFLQKGGKSASMAAFLGGGGAVLLSGVLTSGVLALAGEAFWRTAQLVLVAHLPIALVEGAVTLYVVRFLLKVQPEILQLQVGRSRCPGR